MNKILNPRFLPYFGAVVQAILFAFAGNKFFGKFGWIVGLGVGAVVNYSLALASSRFADIADKRKPFARLSLAAMFLLSPTTITLSMFFSSSLVTAIAWAMCVDLAIVLAGAIAGKSLIPLGEKKPPAKTRSAKTSDGRKSLVKKSAISAGDYACPYTANGCTETKATQNAINAHAGRCKFKLVINDTVFSKSENVKNGDNQP